MLKFTATISLCAYLGQASAGVPTLAPTPTDTPAETPAATPDLPAQCRKNMRAMPGPYSKEAIESACARVKQLDGCVSVDGEPIYHFEREGTAAKPKHILAKALIHGDEKLAGTVARAWIARLEKIEPRNTWRVIPVANPDGWHKNTRTNRHGVDINRNFPTRDWAAQASPYWKSKAKGDPRRNPGLEAASEPETRCLMREIDDFKPDFIISVHTPLGLLDLDGPKLVRPKVNPLRWFSLGNFPGSLGRYMWNDHKVPVLTIELTGNEDVARFETFDQLQDVSGSIAIEADSVTRKPGGRL